MKKLKANSFRGDTVNSDGRDNSSNFYRHKEFIKHLCRKAINGKRMPKFKAKIYSRPIGENPPDANGIIMPNNFNDKLLIPELNLHPEAVAFLFYVDGCAKNLLFYLILFELDNLSGRYSFNAQVVNDYKNYVEQFFDKQYSDSTIKQEHRKLESLNITVNVSYGKYFLNPLISGGKNESSRRNLLCEYSKVLLSKSKKDVFEDLYPYYNSK